MRSAPGNFLFETGHAGIRQQREYRGGYRAGKNHERIHGFHTTKNENAQPPATDDARYDRRTDICDKRDSHTRQYRWRGEGQFHELQQLSVRHAHGDGRLSQRRVNAGNPYDSVTQNGQQRIQHQTKNGSVLSDAANKGYWQEKTEEGYARDGLKNVGKRDAYIAQVSPACSQNAQPNPYNDGDERRSPNQDDVFTGRLRNIVKQRFQDIWIQNSYSYLGVRTFC